jgi:hypothetical protein
MELDPTAFQNIADETSGVMDSVTDGRVAMRLSDSVSDMSSLINKCRAATGKRADEFGMFLVGAGRVVWARLADFGSAKALAPDLAIPQDFDVDDAAANGIRIDTAVVNDPATALSMARLHNASANKVRFRRRTTKLTADEQECMDMAPEAIPRPAKKLRSRRPLPAPKHASSAKWRAMLVCVGLVVTAMVVYLAMGGWVPDPE